MEKVVFTNGCFDIIHPGHVQFLEQARALGTKLVVGINSDASVRAIKGPSRPIQDEESRRSVLLGLRAVDEVFIFEQATPESLIRNIKPDVLVKGGDWSTDQIVGSDFVAGYGGEVFSLPLKEGHSSSSIVQRINSDGKPAKIGVPSGFRDNLIEHQEVFESLLSDHLSAIENCANIIVDAFRSGGKVLLVGNGGSAADAQHIAAEFVGRYETERRALPAIALTTDTSALTALANDYDFERIFARQVEALANSGDCLIAISTSGNSPNVLSAVMSARAKGCRVVGMTGIAGTKLAGLSDASILVPSARTARVQEAHITIAHMWCEMVDREMSHPGTDQA